MFETRASTASPKRRLSYFFCVKLCTVGMAFRISPAIAEASAIRSCECARQLAHAAAEDHGGQHHQTEHRQHDRQQPGAGDEQHHQAAEEQQHIAQPIEMLVPTTV